MDVSSFDETPREETLILKTQQLIPFAFSLDAYAYQERKGTMGFEDLMTINRTSLTTNFVDPMHYFVEDGASIPEDGPGPYLPIWQTAPVLQLKVVNENLLRRVNVSEEAWKALDSESALLGNFINAPEGKFDDINPYTALFSTLLSIDQKKAVDYLGDPLSYLYTPVYDFFKAGDRTVVALMTCTLYWRKYFMGILPDNVNGLVAVLENSCGGRYTYYLEGKEAFPVGYGDLHDPTFDAWKRSGFFIADFLQDGTVTGVPFYQDSCFYSVHVYPSQEYADLYLTSMPLVITFAIAAAFFITTALFIFYDRLVEHRQKIIFTRAMKATAVVASLFPKAVRDKLLNEGKGAQELTMGTKGRLKGFMNGEEASNDINEQCMADLFANCTVMFADISGFTAWSSTREPPQVFMLLQHLYGSFDVLAKRRKVFKVETIGDSYMAVTGVPEPQKKHAIIMVRFAWECLMKMQEVTKELESTLGPDTGDLTMRVGIHSGPVTAGVLKGERARFQLFGDTVNTGKFELTMKQYSFAFQPIQQCLTQPTVLFHSIPYGKYRSTSEGPDFLIDRQTSYCGRQGALVESTRGYSVCERKRSSQYLLGQPNQQTWFQCCI